MMGMGGMGMGMGMGMRGGMLRRAVDGWEDEELGKAYDHKVMMRLLGYMAPYKKRALLAILGTIIFALTSYTQPVLIGIAIDAAVQGKLRELNLLGLTFLGLALGAWGSYYIFMSSTAWIGHRVLYTLRTDMFNHLQKLSLSFYDRHEVGRVMSRVQNDVQSLQELITAGIFTILSDVLGLAVVIFWLVQRDYILALITFSIVPFLILAMYFWQQRAKQAFIRVRQAIAVVNANLQENVSGVRVIQSLSREDENLKRFDRVNADHLNANIQAGRLTAAVMPMVEMSVAIATAFVIIFGGIRVISGDITIGVVATFALFVQRFFEPIRNLVMQYTQLQRAMAGGQRIFEVLDTQPEIVDPPDAIDLEDVRGEVVFDDVSFSYVPGVEVLKRVSMRVAPGETVALVGPTGSGKTTITALVSRFYDVTGGRILIDGHDIRQIKRQSLARRMGIVLQDPFLFSGTVKDNIRYGRPDASDAEIIEAAKAVGAHAFIMRLEKGYDTELHERGQNLSVGQRQLISFARAILSDPRILILDEATANVDSTTEAIIQRALSHLLSGRTSFVIAHRLSTIRGANRIVALQQGEIVEMGTHEELLARDGLYARLYRMTYQERDGAQIAVNGDGVRPTPLTQRIQPLPNA